MIDVFLEIGLVLVLLVMNGFLVCAEMAVLTSRKPKLAHMAEKGDLRAAMALSMAREPDRFLSATQIGITLLTILSGAYGEAALGHYAEKLVSEVPTLAPYAHLLGFGIMVVIITLFTLVVGELAPKRLAIASPEVLAVKVARPMKALMVLAAPASRFLSMATRLVLMPFGLSRQVGSHVSEEEIKIIVREAVVSGVLEAAESDMVERVMRLGDRPVGTLMTHRSKIVALDLNQPEDALRNAIAGQPFTRFPVVRGGLDNMLGVAEAKDLLSVNMGGKSLDLEKLLTQPPYLLETTSAFTLLEQLSASGQGLAMVVDEYGDIQGLVTLTDVLASIVGDMVLPERAKEPRIVTREDGSWLIDGLTPMDEVCALLDRDIPEEGDYQTLAGFVLHSLGRIPAIAEHFEWEGYCFEVVDMDDHRVDRVLVQKIP